MQPADVPVVGATMREPFFMEYGANDELDKV